MQERHLARDNLQTGFVIAGGGFLSYCNHQIIKFEENNNSDFKNNFVIINREREKHI